MPLVLVDAAVGVLVPAAIIVFGIRARRPRSARVRGFGWLLVAVPLPLAVALHLAGRLPATVDQATFLACVAAFALGAALVLSGEEPDWGREDADETPPWWPAFEEEFRAYEASGRSTKVRA
ncbi:MAG: hypothetical protein AUG91_07325 [Actinobacteria bacterium 13_1_20CM_4_69_9]|jgi:hypothetical protein|nr:MAG: hypothetical protein AUG91_07325 [Actinobacteria bacterium 13_1_20CM_4_69_9]